MRVTQLAARQRSVGLHLQRTASTYSLPVGFHEGKRAHEVSERNEASKASLAGMTLQKHREVRLASAFKHNFNASSFSDPKVLYEALHAGHDGKAAKAPHERNIRLLRLSWMLAQAEHLRAAQQEEEQAEREVEGAGVGVGCPPPDVAQQHSRSAPPRHRFALRRRQQLQEEEEAWHQQRQQRQHTTREAREARCSPIFLDLEELRQLDEAHPMPTGQAGGGRVHVACWSCEWEATHGLRTAEPSQSQSHAHHPAA